MMSVVKPPPFSISRRALSKIWETGVKHGIEPPVLKIIISSTGILLGMKILPEIWGLGENASVFMAMSARLAIVVEGDAELLVGQKLYFSYDRISGVAGFRFRYMRKWLLEHVEKELHRNVSLEGAAK